MITKDISNPYQAGPRNDYASDLRLFQVDFAVRDDRAPIGWVFGTFMYNGHSKESDVRFTTFKYLPSSMPWGL